MNNDYVNYINREIDKLNEFIAKEQRDIDVHRNRIKFIENKSFDDLWGMEVHEAKKAILEAHRDYITGSKNTILHYEKIIKSYKNKLEEKLNKVVDN